MLKSLRAEEAKTGGMLEERQEAVLCWEDELWEVDGWDEHFKLPLQSAEWK